MKNAATVVTYRATIEPVNCTPETVSPTIWALGDLDRQAKESRARIEHRTVSIEYKRFTIGAKEFRGRDGFVVRFTSLKLWARIPLIATCTRYNIVW
jgi:hypothetical protein